MKNKIRLKQKAPDFFVETLDGERVRLGQYWGNGRQLLLIFLRHLA